MTILSAMRWISTAIIILLAMLVACERATEPEATPGTTAAPSDPTPSPSNTPELISTPEPVETSLPVTTGITITVWTSPDVAPNNDVPGGAVLLEQLNTFDNDHSGFSLLVELKTISDQGGILSYLRTGRSVAPSILPDVILLPSSQLQTAADQGLIFPLDALLAPDAVEDLYPVARSLAEVNGQIYGYPFALNNLQHLVYNSSVVTQTVSADWNVLADDPPGTLLYAAEGANGAQLTAQFYRALGGAFADENGQPILQSIPLVSALDLLRLGTTQGLLDAQSGTLSSADQVWQRFQDNPGLIIHTPANYFLLRRGADAGNNLRFAPLPGPDGALTATLGAWTWAISTSDSERQAIAADLINWLAAADNVGVWSVQSAVLPARQTAFDYWPDDAYVAFLQRQIEGAEPQPPGLNSAMLTALSDATTDVLLGLSTPAEAAEEARTALTP